MYTKNNKERDVVFDMDDTLWPLNATACKMAKIDYSKIHSYSLSENTLLSKEEKKRLIALYNSVELWQGLRWDKGAKQIHKLEKLGGKVFINSNCLNDAVADFKRSFVGKDLHLPEDQVILNVITNHKQKKELKHNTYIFVEDSPYNIESSTAEYTIIVDKPWNRDIKETDKVIRCYSLDEVISTIEKLLLLE